MSCKRASCLYGLNLNEKRPSIQNKRLVYLIHIILVETLNNKAIFLDLHLSISNDTSIVSTKIYDKRDDFDFEISRLIPLLL